MKTPVLFLLIPLIFLGIAYLRAQSIYSRDPTSFFFDSTRAYDRSYSVTRKNEADAFIESAATKPFRRTIPYLPTAPRPLLCIGIPTTTRPTGDIYVRTTIGSLLAGLEPSERDDIHLMLFVAHSDPNLHPIYTEPWLRNVADQILTYDMQGSQLQHVRDLEKDKLNREKQIWDYTLMLEACMKVNAQYIATFEDDILALDGWFHRTKAALQGIREEVDRKNMDGCKWCHEIQGLGMLILLVFYLRLFYTEQSLGWNVEFWPYYILNSILIASVVVTAISLYLRRKYKYSWRGMLQRSRHVFVLALIYTAVAIGFFFMCGRVSMFPIPNGIAQMPKFACCAQGLVYNPARVPRLIEWYQQKKLGYVDDRAEELANTGEVGSRWAITPSVVQHVGTFSTKGEDDLKKGEVSVSQQRWNFAFELNNATLLRLEHEAVLLPTTN